MRSSESRLAFVLAGGGALGANQVGMLQALAEAGIESDLIVGASVGAINGVFCAFHPGRRGVERLRSLWLGVSRGRVFPLGLRSTLLALGGLRNGMVSNAGLRGILEEGLGRRRIEQSRVECHVVAADASSGECVVLSRGSAVQALLASTAIPGIFEPVSIDGRLLFDGGIASNTPVRTAAELGAREIVVLPTGCQSGSAPSGPFDVAMQALNILIARQLAEDMRQLAGSVRFRIVPPVCPSLGHALDFSRSREMIDAAYLRTRAWLASGGFEREEIPIGLLPPACDAVFPGVPRVVPVEVSSG